MSQNAPAYHPDAFEGEYGFWLFPERDVFHRSKRLRENKHRTPMELSEQVEMIVGEIEASTIDGERLKRGSELRVEFVDNVDGVSELVFETVTRCTTRNSRRGPVTRYTNPMLHPSDPLWADDNYEWDNPQEIYRIECI